VGVFVLFENVEWIIRLPVKPVDDVDDTKFKTLLVFKFKALHAMRTKELDQSVDSNRRSRQGPKKDAFTQESCNVMLL
jgi:hypothetical protein